MNLITRYRLWTISRRAAPDAKFLNMMDARFLSKRAMSYAMRLSASLAALVLSLGLGTSAYAYSSDDITPDHPLYPIRTAVETVEETVAVTPALKQAVQTKMVQRRLREVQVLEAKHPQLQDRPEGQLLKRVEGVLKDGLQNKEAPIEIKQKAAAAINDTDLSRLRPLQRLRLERIKSRLQPKERDDAQDELPKR